MRSSAKIAAMMLVSGAMLCGAQARAQDNADGRYTMTPSGDSMLRLDTKTGAVSHCRENSGKWLCESVTDDRLALEDEIDRLSRENSRLKAQLAARGDSVPAPDPAPEKPQSWLPSDQRVDEFMAFFEKMMRRFKSMAEELKEEPPRSRL